MWETFKDAWQYLKDNDAPNWFGVAFSLFIWPTILSIIFFWLANRKRQSVPGFRVIFEPTQIEIGRQRFDAVNVAFINLTGSAVYLRHAQLKEVPKRFPVPAIASRDMATGKRELVLALPNETAFTHYECILQTNARAWASIAVKQKLDDNFYNHNPSWIRRVFSLPTIFSFRVRHNGGEQEVFRCHDLLIHPPSSPQNR